MMQLPQVPTVTTLYDVGVDYLTFTTKSKRLGKRLAKMCEFIFESERMRGEKPVPCSCFTYKGYKCGALSFMYEGVSTLIRAESHIAKEKWREFIPMSDNVSRIDFQATVQFKWDCSDLATRLESHALDYRAENKCRHDVKLIRSPVTGETLYLGKRTSEVFLRAYDYRRKHGQGVPDNTWRQEVEYKGAQALHLSGRLVDTIEPEALIAAQVRREFSARGLPSLYPANHSYTACKRQTRASFERKLDWLRTAVAPTLAHASSIGRLADALQALGLEEQAGQARQGQITLAMSQRKKGRNGEVPD